MKTKNFEQLRVISDSLRFKIIENSHKSKTPHLGSCLSCIDTLVVLYWNILNIDPKKPFSPERDRFILSKGHAAPALFFTLGEKGFFNKSNLDEYGKDGSFFGEHPPAPKYLPGIEAATGSLGHGLPMGVGMALAKKVLNTKFDVFVIISDGECNEGSIWESAMFAAAKGIDNITVIVDYNKWQATGRSADTLFLEPLADKWRAFGWHTCEVNGHEFFELASALEAGKKKQKPSVIIAHTIKGKGVSFMEDDNNWHYRIPTSEEVELARKELGI